MEILSNGVTAHVQERALGSYGRSVSIFRSHRRMRQEGRGGAVESFGPHIASCASSGSGLRTCSGLSAGFCGRSARRD